MSEKLNESYKLYKKTFNEDFPTIPLAVSLEEKEIIRIISECVKKKKDVYALGYLDNELLY